MKDRYKPILRAVHLLAAILILCIAAVKSACADVVGRLHFTVKNADTDKPLEGAKIVLHDSAGVRPDITLTTDTKGSATTDPLDARPWNIKTTVGKSDEFQADNTTVAVVADTTTEVEILMEPVKEKVIRQTANKETTNQNQTNVSSVRDRSFIEKFPISVGNPQSLNDLLKTNPSFAEDSNNQVHPRGEHSATAYNIDGFYLPGALQGRFESLLTPDTIQSIDALTGGYSPEYGGETAAVLNITLRSGSIKPFLSYSAQMGEFATYYGSITAGGQFGKAIGKPDDSGNVARRFGYLIDVTGRTTNNAVEPPQPGDQTAHNAGESESYFGNFTYQASARDEFKLTINSTPALTQVANRAGLPASFATVGQGYGFVGLRNQNGVFPTASSPTALGAATELLPSQEQDGQDVYTRDVNDFGVLNYRHTFSSRMSALASFGDVHSAQSVLNNSPFINQSALPIDNSIEYNPTIIRNEHQDQLQASLTYSARRHTIKGGILTDEQIGNEFYQLIPASQLALDSEAANAPNLAPTGHIQTDSKGNPVLDAAGNPVYISTGTAPALSVHKTGFYRAAYLQDTWGVTKKLSLNYGLRLDWYRSNQSILGQPSYNGFVEQANLSPRINSAYRIDKNTVFRASYNRLFIQPPQSQGSVVGSAIVPETLTQYDASIERQIAPGQTAKIAYYNKDDRNQIDTNLLIPFTQMGVYTSVNFQYGSAKGFEFSYNLTPRNYWGTSAYFAWANSVDKPGGLQNTGAPVPNYNDHDALNIISTGVAYTWRSGYNLAGTFYFSSGTASSIIMPTDALSDGIRQQHNQVNVSLSTGPGLFGGGPVKGRGGLTLAVENLFNHTSVINFDSGFSGTRFQQGRRIMLTAFGKF